MHRTTKNAAALLLAASLTACAGSVQNVGLVPPPGQAILILAVSRPATESVLEIAGYDPATHDTHNNQIIENSHFDLGNVTDQGFAWITKAPGTYVVQEVRHQLHWARRLAQDTLVFTARPGDILYLGKMTPAPYLAVLSMDVAAKGQTTINSRLYYTYFDAAPPFQLNQALPAASAHAALSLSDTQTIQGMHLATLTPAYFRTGESLGACLCNANCNENCYEVAVLMVQVG